MAWGYMEGCCEIPQKSDFTCCCFPFTGQYVFAFCHRVWLFGLGEVPDVSAQFLELSVCVDGWTDPSVLFASMQFCSMTTNPYP
jgi:hypothetical protein